MIPDPILASMSSSLATFVANLVAAEISKQRAVKDDVSRLKKNYDRVALMMKSAERKAMADDDVARYWIKRVKDHMYGVENLVDQWMLKNEKRRHPDTECQLGSIRWPVGCCLDFSLSRFADAIKALNEDFESILKLPFETNREKHIARSYGKTAPDNNADIVGDYIKTESDNIVKLLKDPMSNCRLIAIVGMVGIGKTTLARMIYHSVKAGTGKHHDFEIKLWIRFSNDLSSLIMWSDCRTEGPTKAQLLKLGSEIANKRFLLVVDSVWTENVWEALLEGPVLKGNRESSRVIVTTRNKYVAKRIGANYIHYVKRMNNSDAWRLLCQRASLDENDEAELQDIGQQIVDKCDGLALAVRSIGRTLRGQEPTRHDWENACRTAFQDLSSEEQYIISLSFQDLSSHMRQCFLYCSIFPEGFFIEKQYIIQQWISEGFIVKKRKSSLEEVAGHCFYELIGRGLLHLEFGKEGVVGAKMPIIVRSFAKDVSDHENFCNESVSTADLFVARRLVIVRNDEANNYNEEDNEDDPNNCETNPSNQCNEVVGNSTNNAGNATVGANDLNSQPKKDAKCAESALLHGLRGMKDLRTLILRQSTVQDSILLDAFKRLTLLRVLDLREVKGIKVLPFTLGRLEHLRYLNISETNIEKVPGTIESLRMLQYLLLRNCVGIHELPVKSVTRLRNLRSLDISGTGISLKNIKGIFRDMEELTSVQGIIPMEKDGSLQLEHLKFPKKLAVLRVEKLEKVLEPPSGTGSEYPIQKYQLKELELCYSGYTELLPLVPEGRLNKMREVLDRFRPHKRLVHLKIENYRGKNYPSWISLLLNLQRLNLQNCLLCEKLPSLGDLPQLKFLALTGFDKLGSIGAELSGDLNTKMVAFPRLQQLHIDDMKALRTWSDIDDQDLPQLQVVRLSGCLKLVAIPTILQKSKTLTRFEVDTGTMLTIKDILQGFADGIVFNVKEQWEPLRTSEIVLPIKHHSQQEDAVAVAAAPAAAQTNGPTVVDSNRMRTLFPFDRKQVEPFMIIGVALCFIIIFTAFYFVHFHSS